MAGVTQAAQSIAAAGSVMISGSLFPGVSRVSSATYIDASKKMQIVAPNVVRFDHDVGTGASLGMLIEPAGATNLLADSVIFAGNTVSPGGTTLDKNNRELPALLDSAAVVKVTTTQSGGFNINFNSAVNTNTGQPYVAACYVWIPSSQAPNITFAQFQTIDRNTGGVRTVANADLTRLDQWQRIVTPPNFALGNSQAMSAVLFLNTGSGGSVFAYTTCWDIQPASAISSHIPTVGGIATRAAESYTPLPGNQLIAAGSLLVAGAATMAQGAQTISGAARVLVAGGLVIQQPPQLIAASGGPLVAGGMTASQGTQRIAGAGRLGRGISQARRVQIAPDLRTYIVPAD